MLIINSLLNQAISPTPLLLQNRKYHKLPQVCCSSKNGNINGLSKSHSPMESGGHDDAEMSEGESQASNVEQDVKHKEIWRLFREAQQNILFLNKQRLMAVEELNKVNEEKKLLLHQVEQLEAEKEQGGFGKDNLSVCSELLLRIDSMVVTGLINTQEASNLRKMVLNYKRSVADVFIDVLEKRDVLLLAELRQFSGGSKKSCYHVIHICTEMEPLISIGALASYVTGISCALQRQDYIVEVILPKYNILDLSGVKGLREIEVESYSFFNGQLHGNKIWTGVFSGIGVTFIQPLYYSSFFSRERVYGYSDDFERFTYFSRAALDYIVKSGKRPDVLHIHNWETAIVGPLFWDLFVNQGLGNTRILFTSQSLDSQCLEHPDKLALCGLDPARLHRPDRLQDDNKTHLINILKGGLVYSNKIVIMSSMHSKGRIVRSLTHGLESTLSIHQDKLLVAPSGFDSSIWDPSTDKFLPENYSAKDLKGKIVCKVSLQKQLGLLNDASAILVGCIFSDLSDVVENLKLVVQNSSMSAVQFILMGNKAHVSFPNEFKDGNVRFIDSYDEDLSHLIFAGCDIMLCHSFHNPVLQVPQKALKYGTAPIAVNSNDISFRHSLDFNHDASKFSKFISSTFGNMSLRQALDEIKNNPPSWETRIKDAMLQDFSWDSECCDIHVSAYSAIKSL